ncbi:probable protein S-acyltransferase 7 [Impatiens glandulifera]|uniref:probable protein S-acyltransferase 7 n=1 Tax=Impatiens glandulifera TaxID=253017 RepID=UPI001FB18F3A|nr:probable protein S-acyltransferase 7 [Impatiens glandulifera]XP_047316892.1 probable protein S-acyltransferase 7 [Impatiens glandulifera]
MDAVHPPQQRSDSTGRVPADRMEMIRIYQAWKGSNRFLVGGRLVFGPDARSIFMTVSLIVIPIAIFCVFVARNLKDYFPHDTGIIIMVLPIALTFWDLILLLLTSARDPGIVPRNLCPPEPEPCEANAEASANQAVPMRLPRVKEVQVNGISVKIKYCDTCMLYRPPRCSHCSICNNCVERFDHHCPWVGQCIGQRNYRFYFMFVLSTTLLCVYVFAFCWVYITRIMNSKHITVWKAMAKTPASIVLIIFTFLAFWFVGGLTVFHLYLISTNQSTYENFRYRYDRRANPYNKGLIRNFAEIFCSRIPASKNKFRRKVAREAEIRSGSMSGSLGGPYMGKATGDVEMGGGKLAVWEDGNSKRDDDDDHNVDHNELGRSVNRREEVRGANKEDLASTAWGRRRSGSWGAPAVVSSSTFAAEDMNRRSRSTAERSRVDDEECV